MPFTLGLVFGGTVAGFVALSLGAEERLLGGMHAQGMSQNPSQQLAVAGEWLSLLLLSVFLAGLLQFGVVGLISLWVQLPLSPRLRWRSLVTVGALVACACTIASCLTIDLESHLEKKGPYPPFSDYLLTVCIIAPLFLLKRAAPSAAEPDVEPAVDIKTPLSAPRTETA
jgi:hypothetical protein